MNTGIVWFRKDLRLHDNPALWEAAQQGAVIPVFIWSKEEMEEHLGEPSLWWLSRSLCSLQQALQAKGLPLILRSGSSLDELMDIITYTKANSVFFNESYEPAMANRDRLIIDELKLHGVNVRTFHANLLLNPYQLFNHQQEPYKIFTAFWRRYLKEQIPFSASIPRKLQAPDYIVQTLNMEEMGLSPSPDLAHKLASYWVPGEKAAVQRWSEFSENELLAYKQGRDFPAQEMVSRLSPHLSWGEISIKAIWHAVNQIYEQSLEEGHGQIHEQLETFQRQLVWREFGSYQLIHYPEMIHTPLRKQFQAFPWRQSEEDFQKWKRGLTGYPLVDAGMRELWETGMMHNRVRMVTASFLVKHLLIPWTKGADWFRQTLADYDIANNAMGWQWVTGCGFDAAPYFRIFNPVTQSEKFDSRGSYIRKWVPELANLPLPFIHRPWDAPKEILDAASIKLGETYPNPMVEHAFARARALAAYEAIKQ